MIRISLTLALLFMSAPGIAQQDRDRPQDLEAVTQLENQWLHAKDAATLDRILAPDFVHVIPADHFLTKQEHIHWFVQHPEPADRRTRIRQIPGAVLRRYGDCQRLRYRNRRPRKGAGTYDVYRRLYPARRALASGEWAREYGAGAIAVPFSRIVRSAKAHRHVRTYNSYTI